MSRRPQRIRVLLVDDHPVVRRGLAACLSRHANLEMVGEAGEGEAALALAARLQPDVVVTDVEMPRMDGPTFTAHLLKTAPGARVLALSVHGQSPHILRMMRAGASGYMLKDSEPDELARGIVAVANGEPYFSRDLARIALNQMVRGAPNGAHSLTPRERDVLIRISRGFSNKQIAADLSLGIRTVETHRERVMKKLNIHTVAGLTKYALAQGWVALETDTPVMAG